MVHTTTVSLTVTTTGTGVISIDFVGQGTVMGSTEVAGVVAKANWNNASGLTNTTGQALVDETGSATGAKVTWNTNGIWILPITDTPGNARMMRGYLDTTGATTTVTVAGLPANAAGYDVYVYADGNNNAATRTGAYQISGAWDHDDERESDGCGEHGFQRNVHAGEQFKRQLREIHGYRDGIHDHGDAGSKHGCVSAGPGKRHPDRTARSDLTGFLDHGESEFADGARWESRNVHGELSQHWVDLQEL